MARPWRALEVRVAHCRAVAGQVPALGGETDGRRTSGRPDPQGVIVPRAYKLYTEAERLAILAAATAERLSATDVNRRFGVKPVTYYSWRMRAGIKSATGR